jgi:hypothetical protein
VELERATAELYLRHPFTQMLDVADRLGDASAYERPLGPGRQFLEGGDESDGAIVLYVLEELYQHLGHMEIAADALMVRD